MNRSRQAGKPAGSERGGCMLGGESFGLDADELGRLPEGQLFSVREFDRDLDVGVAVHESSEPVHDLQPAGAYFEELEVSLFIVLDTFLITGFWGVEAQVVLLPVQAECLAGCIQDEPDRAELQRDTVLADDPLVSPDPLEEVCHTPFPERFDEPTWCVGVWTRIEWDFDY